MTATAVAIGFFDGVHCGHQAVFNTLLSICQANGYEPGGITFPNHPRTLLTGEAVPLLTTCEEKCRLIRALGITALTLLPFTSELQQLNAAQFVETILVQQLKVAHVVVGHDFHFGAGRSGNGAVLTELGRHYGFGVTVEPAFQQHGQAVSSRQIRQFLQQGDLKSAQRMLGRPYAVQGIVQPGRQLGRQLGVPTANVMVDRLLPANGVYAVQVDGPGFTSEPGVANIGLRPTVDTLADSPVLEVHVLDKSLPLDALYGQALTVRFIGRLRDEHRFLSLDALKQQIQVDMDQARQMLSTPTETLFHV